MRKMRMCFILISIALFLVGAYAFIYGWPSFVEHVYTYEEDGAIYQVHEFPWISNSLYNYGIGILIMISGIIFASLTWFWEHDSLGLRFY